MNLNSNVYIKVEQVRLAEELDTDCVIKDEVDLEPVALTPVIAQALKGTFDKPNNDTRLYKCDICNKSFIRKQDIKHHVLEHIEENLYKCDLCYKYFTTKRELDKHINNHPFDCDFCNENFTFIFNL